jgi:hypothetical protein
MRTRVGCEKRGIQMKVRMMPAAAFAAVLVLLLSAPKIAASAAPTGGAQLRITGSVGSNSFNVSINDGDIHSFAPRSGCDGLSSDSYVLQGGAPTGCDNGDDFETTQAPGNATLSGTGYNFAITTAYCIIGGGESETACSTVGTGTGENTNQTIVANPDTGFLTVTNNSGAAFTGSITLTGTSPTQGGTYCPPIGLASDSFSGTLAAGQPWTFALSPDSSNCGGFTPPLTVTLAKGNGVASYTFPVGGSFETWEVTPVNNAGGELLTVTPVLVLQTTPDPGPVFTPGPLFPNASCVPVADFTQAIGPNVCIEFQHTCAQGTAGTNDCGTYVYEAAFHYNLAAGQPQIGGPSFLKADAVGCPTSSFDQNVFLSYDPQNDPVHSTGGGGNSCFAATFDPSNTNFVTTPISVGGYASPFFLIKNPPAVNTLEEFFGVFLPIPLIWQEFDTSNNLVTNPKFFSGGFCKPSTALASCPAHSVALQFVKVDCSTLATLGTPIRANAVLNAVVFNPFNPFKNTFTVGAIPLHSFDDTCQVLQLVTTGDQGVQSTHSAFFHFD